MPYILPKLNYDFKALEPVISSNLLEIHYLKHHQTYVNNLNALLEKYQKYSGDHDLNKMVELLPAIKFNAGGHLNHAFFWESLIPVAQSKFEGAITEQLEKKFGSFDMFKEKFTSCALSIQGSGWTWLTYNVDTKNLQISITINHDRLENNLVPLLVLDMWEHAYYLQYKNVKSDFIKDIWKILNWQKINERYLKII